MTKQFTGNVNQLSQQINAIAMGMAGAKRVFDLIDEEHEVDDGYVTLVNAKIDDNGELVEVAKENLVIGLTTEGSDRTFFGFGIYTRGDATLIDSLEMSMDNITIGTKAPTGGTGPVLPDEDFGFIDQPGYDEMIPEGWVEEDELI
jgi:ABC-type multidrug transport system fused ATPase/permease subunit